MFLLVLLVVAEVAEIISVVVLLFAMRTIVVFSRLRADVHFAVCPGSSLAFFLAKGGRRETATAVVLLLPCGCCCCHRFVSFSTSYNNFTRPFLALLL